MCSLRHHVDSGHQCATSERQHPTGKSFEVHVLLPAQPGHMQMIKTAAAFGASQSLDSSWHHESISPSDADKGMRLHGVALRAGAVQT